MTEPLFRSAHDALVFAFNYSSQQYGKTPMSKVAVPASGSGKGLSGTDGAAQSGMIRLEVSALGKLPEAILIARFAPHTMSCSCRNRCCIGKTPNDEWTGAIHDLADHLKDNVLSGSYTTWDMRLQYIMRLFVPKQERLSLVELASRNNVHENTVNNHFAAVRRVFGGKNGIEAFSLAMIDERLTEIGMIFLDSCGFYPQNSP